LSNKNCIRKILKNSEPASRRTLIVNAHFNKQRGNDIIKKGLADLVAFGKLLISNPDLPGCFRLNATPAHWDKKTLSEFEVTIFEWQISPGVL